MATRVRPESRLVAGRFRVIRRLGAGAMASVFLAEDVELGRRVAIKRLHPDSGAEVAPRFRREMRVAASLSHPNVVKLFDAIEHEGAVLLVMEYVDGPSLARAHGRRAAPPDEALAILRPLAGAVDHLHAQGVIHRDIKPANVMLDREDRVKLTDLGIASAAQATGITTTGTMLGTPAYMAPELFDGDRATDAADVYSVAAIAFEMLTGRRAREGGTPAVIALRAATEPPPDVRDVWPEAAALAAASRTGMARDPAERPASATALVDEIAAALEEDDRARRRRGRARPAPPTDEAAARCAGAAPSAARARAGRAADAARCAGAAEGGARAARRGAGARPRAARRAPAAAPRPTARAAPRPLLAAVACARRAMLVARAAHRRRRPDPATRRAARPRARRRPAAARRQAVRTTSTGGTAAGRGRRSTPAARPRVLQPRRGPPLRRRLGARRARPARAARRLRGVPAPVLDRPLDRVLPRRRGPPHGRRGDRRDRHDGHPHRPRRPLHGHRRHRPGDRRRVAGHPRERQLLTPRVSPLTSIAST